MPRLLVTGASGYLGSILIPFSATVAETIGVARNTDSVPDPGQCVSLDITDGRAVAKLLQEIKPDAIIHAAASNPGSDEATMDAVNHQGSLNVAKAARDLQCRLVAVSTDVVHSGQHAPYADDAESSPLPENTYACTKALGEKAVLTNCAQAVVVRTSLIYGLESMDRGTAGFAERLASGQPLQLFDDVLRQPVFVDALAQGLCALALQHTEQRGIINLAGEQVMSRAEFGRLLLDWWNVDTAGASINDVSGNGVAGLPLDLRMNCRRAGELGLAMPGVSAVLAAHTDSN